MISKDGFSNSFEYERASAESQYKGVNAIDPKFADLCLKETVQMHGEGNSSSVDICEAATECTYANDKLCGVSGTCLKEVVGISEVSLSFSDKK